MVLNVPGVGECGGINGVFGVTVSKTPPTAQKMLSIAPHFRCLLRRGLPLVGIGARCLSTGPYGRGAVCSVCFMGYGALCSTSRQLYGALRCIFPLKMIDERQHFFME